MISSHILDDLLVLIRRRYPDWESCEHPQFVADETSYKRAAAAKAAAWLSPQELERLVAAAEFDEVLSRLERLANQNNLLWRRVPSAGDTAVLQHPNLDQGEFCVQVQKLLYGDASAPDRLQAYSDYLAEAKLPNGWPLPTYLLFMVHADSEIFVKPQAAQWFLQYMGETAVTVTAPPTARLYRQMQKHAQALHAGLAEYGAQDMIDVQSFIWVCFRESKARTGGLDKKGQIDLDVPNSTPLAITGSKEPATALREETAVYHAPPIINPTVSLAELATETGYQAENLDRWVRAIRRKGQAVFYGPPGTGKTFVAQRLARYLSGGGDGLVELVQFHPAYAYEDFIQGIRPVTVGGEVRYEMKDGRFLDFCRRSEGRGPSVFIIDELNRANVAAVFGELMLTLEYRDREIPLAGGGAFGIPRQVTILATMNTADRSIALVDHALRRRFAFIPLWPSAAVIRHYHVRIESRYPIETLIALLNDLNAQLDPQYHVGHSYFLNPDLATHLPDIWQLEIEPFLEEYFFSQPDRVAPFRWQQVKERLQAATSAKKA